MFQKINNTYLKYKIGYNSFKLIKVKLQINSCFLSAGENRNANLIYPRANFVF